MIIASSAFSIMFGTIIAVFDGYSRSLQKIVNIWKNQPAKDYSSKSINPYVIFILVLGFGSFFVIYQFGENLKQLVDVATTISFLLAPIVAIMNFRLVTGKYMTKKGHPPFWLKGLSFSGIIFLSAFAIIFIFTRFF